MTWSLKDVPARVDVDELEQEILAYWEAKDIFGKTLAKNKSGEHYVFYDGPPYATGKPHYGHLLQSAIKDTILRYKTMRGYKVPRAVGWDCHGLPVETIVEKELGFTGKKEIEEYGIEKFNQRCRETVTRYIDEFTATLKRFGRWAAYETPYFTMDRNYMETEWAVFKQLWEKKLVYRAFRSTPYCVRCETPLSNFEVSMAYKDKIDMAVYVILKVDPLSVSTDELREDNDNLWLLVWTTTPWTLPGNAAVAFNPELEYVSVKHKGRELIAAKSLVRKIFGEEVKPTKLWRSEELRQLHYEPLFPPGEIKTAHDRENVWRLLESDHVTADEGTGLVHIAPAFGEEDYLLGKQYDLPVLRTVGVDGKLTAEVAEFAGEHIFAVNEKILSALNERDVLFRSEQYKHSYPFCWRCDTPLIYFALDSWFVRIADLKERMLKLNQQINWIPEHVKNGRFGKGIESAPDWAVSRNRYWSVPLPIWQCDKCLAQVCVGSSQELGQLAGVREIADLHRPYVDKITWDCDKCAGHMQRVPEVLDVWFDSGSMPYTQSEFPADFIAESIEQTRAWFYTLHVLATALKGQAAFKNAIASGLIFAEDGQKLSKKLKNYPEPEPTIKKYGADMLRFYLLVSTSLGEPYRFSEKELKQLARNFYQMLWNVYSFFTRYANVHNFQIAGRDLRTVNLLDRWLLARLQLLELEVTRATDAYQIDQAARMFIPFINDLSNWYVRRSRGRFQSGEVAAFTTLHKVLVRLAKLLAPFVPYVSEAMYRNLVGKESVHLEDWMKPKQLSPEDKKLLTEMSGARVIVSEALALRAQAGIKTRQPLAEAVVQDETLHEALQAVITDEINVKKITFKDDLPAGKDYVRTGGGGKKRVALNIVLTPELKREGIAREIIRHGQVIRRNVNLKLDDRISLSFRTDDEEIGEAFAVYQEMIMKALQADDVWEDAGGQEVTINKRPVFLGVAKK